ncbi:MAG: 16S rRNA (uracil(1498)-N(3))-methyltransferase [Calditerrivibrio sp.]|nr:16S rRNA (uracil(1498)-N(3))-methyltransferase [Calditerrivibrio sp.]MCA1933179.1 16S rRNA (uracil(1498)-N(3))-methyltransferase [Calditerrivibrio sp.]MCA1980118.1 16S rRNA (uracil(1498)-N(3))-methyltransferase [Calditerrivibrio sp.]
MTEKLKRFFVEKELSDELEIDEDLYHQLKNVLRMKIGDKYIFMNEKEIGEYQFYFGMKKSGIFNIINKSPLEQIDYNLDVYLSLLQREYLDFTVEKMGEIGVTSITPIITRRSIQSINSNTLDRMKKLLYKGILQAEHNFFPTLNEPLELKDIMPKTDNNFLLYERECKKSKINLSSKNVSILIGPEGGLENIELDTMKDKGFHIVSPINGVLKAETAAIIFAGYFKIMIDTY